MDHTAHGVRCTVGSLPHPRAKRAAGGSGSWLMRRETSLTRGAKCDAGVPGTRGIQGARDALVDAQGTEAQKGRDGARSARTHLMVAQGRGTRRYNTLVIVPWHYGQRETPAPSAVNGHSIPD